MDLSTTALILVLLLLAWLFVRRRQAAKSDQKKPVVRTSAKGSAYHAVSIKFANHACAAAREMEGRRFLSSAAPRLPLPECDVLDCSCRFAHHKDRRSKDRRSPFGPGGIGGSTGKYQQEQREGRDRRRSDDDDLY